MKGIWVVLVGLLVEPGTITYRAGSEVYLQAGSRQGLSVGQVFWVVSPEGDTAGRVEVLSVSEARALARIVEESIPIQPGFRVLLPQRGEEPSPTVPSSTRSSAETGAVMPASHWRGAFSTGGDVQNLTRRSWRWFSRAWTAFRRGPWEGEGLARVERIGRDTLVGIPGQEWRSALYRLWLGVHGGPVRFRAGRFLAHTLPVRVDGGEVQWTFPRGSVALFGGVEARPDAFSTGEPAGGLAFAWTLPGGRGEIRGGIRPPGDRGQPERAFSFQFSIPPRAVSGPGGVPGESLSAFFSPFVGPHAGCSPGRSPVAKLPAGCVCPAEPCGVDPVSASGRERSGSTPPGGGCGGRMDGFKGVGEPPRGVCLAASGQRPVAAGPAGTGVGDMGHGLFPA